MSNRTFLILHSGIYAVFAALLLVMPNLIWPIYGVELNDRYALFLSQHNSIFLGGIAVLGYQFRACTNKELLKKLLTGLLWTNLFGLAITLYAAIAGIFTGLGWSDPIFFALLAALSYRQRKINQQAQ